MILGFNNRKNKNLHLICKFTLSIYSKLCYHFAFVPLFQGSCLSAVCLSQAQRGKLYTPFSLCQHPLQKKLKRKIPFRFWKGIF